MTCLEQLLNQSDIGQCQPVYSVPALPGEGDLTAVS